MDLQVDTIKPGILVTEHVSLTGGIHYQREYLDSKTEDQTLIREWHTVATTDNVGERKGAQRVASKVYTLLRRVCVQTPVGLICPLDKSKDLEETLTEVRETIDEFNKVAMTCKILAYHACFEVSSTNRMTLQAILDKVGQVASSVDAAITMQDTRALEKIPKRFLNGISPHAALALPQEKKDALLARVRAELIREAIAEAKGFDSLLPDTAGHEVREVIREARGIARKICNRVERRGEILDEVINEVDLTGIRRTRAAFVLAAARIRGTEGSKAQSFSLLDVPDPKSPAEEGVSDDPPTMASSPEEAIQD